MTTMDLHDGWSKARCPYCAVVARDLANMEHEVGRHVEARNRALAQRNAVYALLVVLVDEKALAPHCEVAGRTDGVRCGLSHITHFKWKLSAGADATRAEQLRF